MERAAKADGGVERLTRPDHDELAATTADADVMEADAGERPTDAGERPTDAQQPPAEAAGASGQEDAADSPPADSPPADDPPADDTAADATAEPGADAAEAATGDDVAAQAALAAEYYDRLVRLQAEFDNYRKRMQRERESDVKYAGERFVQAMLPVLDNFERALAAVPDSEETQAWRQGIVMIQRQLIEVLEKEGVTAVVADPGTAFDPHQHEAVFYEESSEYGEGQIIGELQRGYRLHDRLIRPALVRVAQG